MYFFGYGGNILDYFMRYRNKLRRAPTFRNFRTLRRDVEVLRSLYSN
jgi:hypothetical protein